MTRARGLIGALALPLALAACGDSGGAGGDSDAAHTSNDGGADVAFMGAASSGQIPRGPALDAEAVDYGPLASDALPGCCMVRLALPDATGDASWARIKGDLGALKGEGVSATWSDGAWSAMVCLPAGLVTKYHFELPAPQDDAGASADAGVADAGAAPTVWRVNEDVSTGFDDDANEVNVAAFSPTCSLLAGVAGDAGAAD